MAQTQRKVELLQVTGRKMRQMWNSCEKATNTFQKNESKVLLMKNENLCGLRKFLQFAKIAAISSLKKVIVFFTDVSQFDKGTS